LSKRRRVAIDIFPSPRPSLGRRRERVDVDLDRLRLDADWAVEIDRHGRDVQPVDQAC
jgi:hypothetical protein